VGHHAVILDPTRRDARIPRPGLAALPLLALAAASMGLDAAPELPWTVGVAVAGLFLVAAAARALQRYAELRQLRAAADRLIRRDDTRTQQSPFLGWRAEELTKPSRRRTLARSLRHIVRELDASALPGASPLNRRAARPYVDKLSELARLVEDPDVRVSARGVLLAESLLTDAASPLYDRARAGQLPSALTQVERALRETGRSH
jgi:hypothetical protein